ncbi:hypothetical protein ACFE04_010192 [Oxalis oulophora]
MVLIQASKLSLSSPSSLTNNNPIICSLQFEPISNTLALTHSDSSITLYSSLSNNLSSLSSLPTNPKTLIPNPSSSSSFLLIRHNSNPESDPRLLFLVGSPFGGGSQILIRFYNLNGKNGGFVRVKKVVCSQKGIQIDEKLGALLDVSHGISVKLVGSVNYFAVYSITNAKVWVFAVSLVKGDDCDDNVVVKLMRCCVVECSRPVFEIRVCFGLMVLGEENGVRVFNLRQLVKGKMNTAKNGKSQIKGVKPPNGVVGHGKSSVSVKLKSVKCRQESSEGCFVAFENKEMVDCSKPAKSALMSLKAVTVEALGPHKFLILDSIGELHILHLSKPVTGSNLNCHMRPLHLSMKVEKLAVLPDISSGFQTVWISDGSHTLHVVSVADIDTAADGNDKTETEEKQMQISVLHAIFASEKIDDMVPSSANGIIVLGQGNIYAYANS